MSGTQTDTHLNFTIQRVRAGQATLDNFNTPIAQIEDALDTLGTSIANIQSKSSILLFDQPVEQDTVLGSLVYYKTVDPDDETSTAKFAPAKALLAAAPGQQGQCIASPQAVVCGMLVDSSNSSESNLIGTILVGGMYTASAQVMAGCFGGETTPTPGLYYLSPTQSGKVVKDPGQALRQPVLEYLGNNKILLSLFYLAHDSHQHASYVLLNTWAAVSGESAPAGCSFKYVDTTPAFAALGQLTAGTTAVFYNGVLQYGNTADIVIGDDNNVYAKTVQPPATGSVVLINHWPLAYGSPIVRSVRAQEDSLLAVKSVRGDVTLALRPYQNLGLAAADTAVAGISGSGVSYTRIVSSLTSGPGIVITPSGIGAFTISSNAVLNTYIDASLVDLQGAIRVSDTTKTMIRLPRTHNTGFTMYCSIPYLPNGTIKASPWVQCCGGAGQLSIQTTFIGQGTAGDPWQSSAVPAAATISLPSGIDGYFIAKADSITVQTAGCLIVKVSAEAPAVDIDLFRQGIYLQAGAGTAMPLLPDTQATAHAIVFDTFFAGQEIPAFRVVYVSSETNTVNACDASSSDTYGKAVGVTKASALQNDRVQYVAAGLLEDPGLDLTPGQPVYVGADGRLVEADQVSGLAYVQRIGIALSSSALQVSIGTAVLNS